MTWAVAGSPRALALTAHARRQERQPRAKMLAKDRDDGKCTFNNMAAQAEEHYIPHSSASVAAEHALADTYKVRETVLERIGA